MTMIMQRGGKGGGPLVVTLLRAVPRDALPMAEMPRSLPVSYPQQTAKFEEKSLRPDPLPSVLAPAPSLPTREPPALPTRELPVHTSEMDQALTEEFNNIAFLWGGREPDPVVAALVHWKDDLLCKTLDCVLHDLRCWSSKASIVSCHIVAMPVRLERCPSQHIVYSILHVPSHHRATNSHFISSMTPSFDIVFQTAALDRDLCPMVWMRRTLSGLPNQGMVSSDLVVTNSHETDG